MNRQERRWLLGVGLALLLFSNLPYAIAWAVTPADAHFTGLVFNPIDGHSYLAKMRQGLEGSWRFQLAFTPEQSAGAPVFLFHLWLGHLARWTGLPLIALYHGARVLGGVAMVVAVYALITSLSDQRRERSTMFLLTLLGSGLGWLTAMLNLQTADLWVPEAFPSYSLMANAHFPLAIGLMSTIAYSGLRVLGRESEPTGRGRATRRWGLLMAFAAVLLGAVQPFGLVPVFGALAIAFVARAVGSRWGSGRSVPWQAGAWIVTAAAAALPYPVYMQASILSDPVLARWSAQNVTSSPPLWDWALSYGVILVLAVWGAVAVLRRRHEADFLPLGWAAVTLAGMYLPLALQRRISIGLGVPLGILAGIGWWRGARSHVSLRARGLMRGLVVAFSALTPVFLIAAAVLTAVGPQPADGGSWLYLSNGEWAALRWLRKRPPSDQDAVVLCAPQTGTFVPAWSGQRVVYGHPFETVNAERREEQVKAYWTGHMSTVESASFLRENGVDYVFIGPRERSLMEESGVTIQPGDVVFEQADTRIYAVPQ